jgi:PEP-CTERM motif
MHIAFLAMLALAPVRAMALTQTLGAGIFSAPGQTLTTANSGLGPSFEDKLVFSLSTNLGLSGSFFWKNSAVSTLTDFSAKLYRVGASGGHDSFIVGSQPAIGNSTSFGAGNPGNLGAGNYYLLITGNGGVTTPGRFSASLSSFAPSGPLISPVPEPGTWVMMLAGLLLMTFKARNRNRRNETLRSIRITAT